MFSKLFRSQKRSQNRPKSLLSRKTSRSRLPRFEPLEERTLLSLTVALDKTEYMPEEPVNVTVSGLTPSETMQLQVLHTEGTPNTGPAHDPVQVADGGEYDLDGAANGVIQVQWYVDNEDADSAFTANATTLMSGETTSTTFTTGHIPPWTPTITVLTDKDDYAPGGDGHLHGQRFRGW